MKIPALGLFLCLLALAMLSAHAQPTPQGSLFVLTAASGTADQGVLNLELLHPEIIYFSDRPKRVAGKLAAEQFFKSWSRGKDSFADDPPNASLSLAGDDESSFVVELKSATLSGQIATFEYEIISGELPQNFDRAFLFIDSKVVGIDLGLAREEHAAMARARSLR